MIVFNKNAHEVAVKVKLFNKYDVGLQSDYQVAMLANLSSFFKVKVLVYFFFFFFGVAFKKVYL